MRLFVGLALFSCCWWWWLRWRCWGRLCWWCA